MNREIHENNIFSQSPTANINNYEFEVNLKTFCSFLSILYGKRMSYSNIFLQVLKNDRIKELYMLCVGEENEYEALRLFLNYEPSVCKSKYISKYINTHK